MSRRSMRWISAAMFAAGLAGCSTSPAPQYVVSGTGSVSGILFLDRDHNGVFDPSAGDSALGNVHVQAYNRGSTTTIPGADTHTDSLGRFTLNNLPPGTFSLQIDTTGISSVASFCNNPLPVSVYRDETAFVAIDARNGCVVPIATAEAMPLGSHVTIRGTVTSTLAQISTGQAYIEDETGGIQLFSPSGHSFNIGDVVEVSGTLAVFSNELELSPSTINTVSAGVPLTPAVETTGAAASAGGDNKANLQGRLIQIKAAKLLDNFTTGAGRNAQINDGSGALTVRFDSHVVSDTTTLKTTFTAGKCYNWTGILKAFTTPPVELFPRTLSDVTEVPCP